MAGKGSEMTFSGVTGADVCKFKQLTSRIHWVTFLRVDGSRSLFLKYCIDGIYVASVSNRSSNTRWSSQMALSLSAVMPSEQKDSAHNKLFSIMSIAIWICTALDLLSFRLNSYQFMEFRIETFTKQLRTNKN